MDFAMLPPEVNSGRMYAGPGSGPMVAAAAAWDGLAAELQSTSASYESVISELSGGSWLGPSSASMAAAAAPYVEWMTTAAAQAEQTATQAKAAAAAYEAAFAMTVPPAVVAANRALLTALIATNVLGQNTAAIAATETDYAEMWAQDAAAMYGYASQSTVATKVTPFTPPAPTTNPGGVAGQAAAVDQAASTSAGTAQTIMSSGRQLMSAVPQALQGLAQPLQAANPPSALSSLMSLTSLFTPVIALIGLGQGSAGLGVGAGGLGYAVHQWPSSADRQNTIVDQLDTILNRLGAAPAGGSGAGAFVSSGSAGLSASGAGSVSAGIGQAGLVGRLSVPQGWATAAPAIRPVAAVFPITAADAGPEIAAGNSGNLFADMALAGAAGRAVAGTAAPARGDQRIRMPSRDNPKPAQRQLAEPVAEIAAELRELATRAQSLLAKLADSGLMTSEEVTEQKRRFTW
jgi:PPE-repeat protein